MKNMKVGFTGTRQGLSEAQRGSLGELLVSNLCPSVFLHGSCQGADVEAACLVRQVSPSCRIIALPGPDGDPHQRKSGVDDEARPPKTHFARNRDIVLASDVLVACPLDMSEQPRGGTWYTISYARKHGKHLVIIWPDGSITKEPGRS